MHLSVSNASGDSKLSYGVGVLRKHYGHAKIPPPTKSKPAPPPPLTAQLPARLDLLLTRNITDFQQRWFIRSRLIPRSDVGVYQGLTLACMSMTALSTIAQWCTKIPPSKAISLMVSGGSTVATLTMAGRGNYAVEVLVYQTRQIYVQYLLMGGGIK